MMDGVDEVEVADFGEVKGGAGGFAIAEPGSGGGGEEKDG